MELQKVILYYGFVPMADPEAVRLWQHLLCKSLNLKGRILISEHGINATLGGNMSDLKSYVKATKLYPGLNKIDVKWSEGYVGIFEKLSVKVRDEIVSFGAPGELKVDHQGVVNGGVHLKPEEVNQLVAERGDDVIFFDGRNAYEAVIGRFENAIVPDVETTKDFVAEIESGKYDHLKDKPIVTYCTGGIRCEILSSVMINRGFNEVYQLEGGIVRYGEKYREKGLWKGSLYVFDGRMNMDFSDNTTLLGTCEGCAAPTNTYQDCGNNVCRKLTLLCESCLKINTPENCHHDLTIARHETTVG